MDWSIIAEEVVVVTQNEVETDRLGRLIATLICPGLVIGLVGTLGVGKTRLSRAIAEALGADPAAITSPTYVLVHEYDATLPIYHFDAYRLASPEEFEALGTDEYFSGNGVCLVEWADLVETCLPKSSWWISMEAERSSRRIRLKLDCGSAEQLISCLKKAELS